MLLLVGHTMLQEWKSDGEGGVRSVRAFRTGLSPTEWHQRSADPDGLLINLKAAPF